MFATKSYEQAVGFSTVSVDELFFVNGGCGSSSSGNSGNNSGNSGNNSGNSGNQSGNSGFSGNTISFDLGSLISAIAGLFK